MRKSARDKSSELRRTRCSSLSPCSRLASDQALLHWRHRSTPPRSRRFRTVALVRPGRTRLLKTAFIPGEGRWRRPPIAETCAPPPRGYARCMTIADIIYEQVKDLPDHAAREVLDFVGFIRERGERAEWRNLMNAQSASLASVWDNPEDQVWDNTWARRSTARAFSFHRFVGCGGFNAPPYAGRSRSSRPRWRGSRRRSRRGRSRPGGRLIPTTRRDPRSPARQRRRGCARP